MTSWLDSTLMQLWLILEPHMRPGDIHRFVNSIRELDEARRRDELSR